MSLLGRILGPWVDDALATLWKREKRARKAADAVTADALKDNDRFEAECVEDDRCREKRTKGIGTKMWDAMTGRRRS